MVPAYAQDIAGTWYGMTEEQEHLILDVRRSGKGFSGLLDIPEKNMFRIRMDSVYFQDNDFYLIHQGLQMEYSGAFDGQRMEGTFKIKNTEGKLDWFSEPLIERTQKIKLPLPYVSKHITFTNKQEDIELAGTLTMPSNKGSFPAVVLITGSGAQNRDEEIMGHKPFLVLADHLTRKGIAVLRYDDRGTGESKGQFRPATAENYANDAWAAVEFLQNHPNIRKEKIGLVGHSEGGNIATMLASKDGIGFLVLLAAPGVSNLDMYLVQLDNIFALETPEVIERDVPHWRKVYTAMAQIENKEVLRDTLDHLFSNWLKTIPEEELMEVGAVEKYKAQEVARHHSDWYHYFLRFDVNDYLSGLKMPILALNGNKDIQVDARQNLGGFQKALDLNGHPNYKTVELDNVNHFFQPCERGDFPEIYFLKETFSIVALEEISTWINKEVVVKDLGKDDLINTSLKNN